MSIIKSFKHSEVENAFTIFQTDFGTSPTADSATDTITLTSTDGSITITGSASTDTIEFALVLGNIDHDSLLNFTTTEHFTMLDEDDFASDSNTQAATQQSIKAYIDSSTGGALTAGSVVFSNGTTLIEDNANFFYDDTNDRLILGTNISIEEHSGLTVVGDVDVLHVAIEPDDHAMEIDCDAAGFGDVKAIDIDYITGALATGQDEAVILINIDESLATGGDVSGLEVITTEGSANVFGLFAAALVNPIEQLSGVFVDMDSALVKTTDRLAEFISTGSNIVMFVDNADTVTIGNATKFEEIEFLLATAASGAGIKATFEFSSGAGPTTYTSFTPVDGTNSMRNSGVVVWLDGDIPGWVVDDNNEFSIRIIRTRNSLTTSPIESLVQISSVTEYSWNKDGNLNVNAIAANVVVVDSITIDGTSIVSSTTLDIESVRFSGGTITLVSVLEVGEFQFSSDQIVMDNADLDLHFTGAGRLNFDDSDGVAFGSSHAEELAITGSGAANAVIFRFKTNTTLDFSTGASASAAVTADWDFHTGHSINTVSGKISIHTGNITSGAGTSGDLDLSTGTSTGTRGDANLTGENVNVIGDTLTTIGVGGDIELGEATVHDMFPNTDGSMNLGKLANSFGTLYLKTGFTTKQKTITQLGASRNDWNIGIYSFPRVDSDAAYDVTGISSGVDGHVMYLTNFGAFTITLKDQSVSSGAVNRFLNNTGADLALLADHMALLIYDNIDERWRVSLL